MSEHISRPMLQSNHPLQMPRGQYRVPTTSVMCVILPPSQKCSPISFSSSSHSFLYFMTDLAWRTTICELYYQQRSFPCGKNLQRLLERAINLASKLMFLTSSCLDRASFKAFSVRNEGHSMTTCFRSTKLKVEAFARAGMTKTC